MGKPYKFKNLINLFVMITMLGSSFLTLFFVVLLRAFRLVPSAFFATLWMPFVLLLVANAITALVHYILVPKVIRPIQLLIEATGKVAKGDFSVHIQSDEMVGEVRELVDSFNAMTKDLGGIEIFRSDFIHNFSHELKTPIVSMKGFAKQLKNPNLTEEERRQYCDIIISESERLTEMSENILLLSKLENQQIVGDKKDFRLDEELRQSILLLEKEWEEKELELELELAPITLRDNADLLRHVWTNLFSNAIKFTPKKGKITVQAKENESCAIVTVRDTGIGMTEEQMKHIFDKCYQADSSRGSKGNGLGLCIAGRACQLSGGSISVRSQLGKGSVFTVILPKRQKEKTRTE
ncbi:MAG: HAMP domain-containing histidine kinase [Clostridia bacterium]|nr:HAMP domain-containing histidine kinase [Clostridia bacterium]